MSRRIVRPYETSQTSANPQKQYYPHPDDYEDQPDAVNRFSSQESQNYNMMENGQQSMQREASFGSLLSDVSENTDRSTSSCSWDEEIDSGNCEKIKEVLESIEDFLYEDKYPLNVPEDIIDDCKLWGSRFPHLRITGRNPPERQTYEKMFHLEENETEANSLSLENEEIIEEHHSVNGEESPTILKSDKQNSATNEPDLSELKDKVIEELVKKLLPKVLDWQNATTNYSNTNRPYSAAPRLKRNLRPMTAEENRLYLPPVSPLSQPLQGILTISSKILQDRKIKSTSSIIPNFRPSSSTPAFQENRCNSLYSSAKNKPSRVNGIPKLASIIPDSNNIFPDHLSNKAILPDITSPTQDLSQTFSFSDNKNFRFGTVGMNGISGFSKQFTPASSRPGTGRLKNIYIPIETVTEENAIPIIDIHNPKLSASARRSNSRLQFQMPH